MLKRHLNTEHQLTPHEYRERYGLPRDYPLVAPDYAKVRSRLAKKIGLGHGANTRLAAKRAGQKAADQSVVQPRPDTDGRARSPSDLASIRIVLKLRAVMADIDLVAAHAKTSNGQGVRDPWLLLAASEQLRRCVDTALRVQKAMNGIDHLERFHAAILEEVGRESPECAQRILQRLNALAQDWGG